MSAKLMANALSQLMLQHGVELTSPPAVPLVAHTDVPMVLYGYASTCRNVDAERMAFAKFAFGTTLPTNCQLLFEHNDDAPAGVVDNLSYDATGNLMCRALVTHAQARRCNAFSIGARVRAFEVCNADSPDFYALVTAAEITDVSLVQRPVNPRALVTSRDPESPHSAIYSNLKARAAVIERMAVLLTNEVVKVHGVKQ